MAAAQTVVGVLALQGAYEAHKRMLQDMGVATRQVRQPRDLQGLDALVLPGGESTTLLHFLQQGTFWQDLQAFVATRPCLGTCAGLILLAQQVEPAQPCLGALAVTVQRNAYGRQRDSRIRQAATILPGGPMEMVFIRAPRIVHCDSQVQVLAFSEGSPVLVRQGGTIGCAFHPELSGDRRVHQLLLDAVRG